MALSKWTSLLPAIAILLLAAACSRGGAEADTQTAGQPLTATATDNLFTPNSYTVSAGQPYTLTMTNTGDAIHNWHVLDAKNESGKDITTPLTPSHKVAHVTFSITKAGLYHFQCDVHPDTMKGTITVRGS